MGFLRSEDMYLFKFVVSKDYAWSVVHDFGRIHGVHFLDMNRNDQLLKLPYTDMIKRCEETERRLMFLRKECNRYRVKIVKPPSYEFFYQSLQILCNTRKKVLNVIFEDIERDVKERESFVFSQNERIKVMNDVLNELIEYKTVLEKSNKIIHGVQGHQIRKSVGNISMNTSAIETDSHPFGTGRAYDIEEIKEDLHKSVSTTSRMDSSFREVNIKYVAGTISKDEMLRFKRILFRATRGKILQHFEEIDTPLISFQGDLIQKVVYILIFQEGVNFKERVLRICDSFQSKRFSLPEGGHGDQNSFNRKIKKLDQKIKDTIQMIKITQKQMHEYLEKINQEDSVAFSVNEVYSQFIMKEKMIYRVLNQLKKEGNLYYGFFWSNLPKHQVITKFQGIHRGNMDIEDHNVQIEQVEFTKIRPPTYIMTNDFTKPFQLIVDTYGIPTYKEINPAMFACVTFPFLFGVMFGDIGHGAIYFLLGLFLCFFSSTLKYRVPSLRQMLKIRYLLLLMGFFATFCGLIYNDMMSIPLELFKSCFDPDTGEKLTEDCIYPFGIDPIWYLASNQLIFMNSLKMKTSVIFAVLQMSLGIWMKALNSLKFNNKIEFFHEFVPQIILLWALFGYMDTLIVIKWVTNYEGQESNAPSIIGTMIGMALNLGEIKGQPFIVSEEINRAISISLLVLAVICVPWMLLAKPLLLRKQHSTQAKYEIGHSQEIEMQNLNVNPQQKNFNLFVEEEFKEGGEENFGVKGSPIGSEFDKMIGHAKTNEETVIELLGQTVNDDHNFGDLFIHQMIETIEFVLGTISNTASYLRLWALSLAHSQLASVFFEQTLLKQLNQGSAIGLFFALPLWASFTFGVLLMMDAMECFLHTLRLHWVEFQNKFYKGQGYRFIPFSFLDIFADEDQ